MRHPRVDVSHARSVTALCRVFVARVLRPGGRLLLADHIASSYRLVRGVQRLAEVVSVPAAGEHFRRRPLHEVEAAGFEMGAALLKGVSAQAACGTTLLA